MTKPAIPSPVRNDVIEMDAMDVAEWESGQRTPQAPDANLAELVRKTATSPESPARVQTIARPHASTQIGAPVIPQPSSRARTAPPGPAPKPTRPRTSGGPPPASARATPVPDLPTTDFSLPVTSTGEGSGRLVAPASKPQPSTPASGGIDFSLPITSTGEDGGRPSEPEPRRSSASMPGPTPGPTPGPMPGPMMGGGFAFSTSAMEAKTRPFDPPRPRTAAGSTPELSRTAIAVSESGAQPPEPLPPTSAPSPFAEPSRGWPRHSTSPFAERSRGGPGHNASPAGGAEPNTAWPPRQIPVDASSQPARLAAPDPSIRRSQLPGRHGAGGADRLKVALSRRRLWWIGSGIASASVAAILAALAFPNPEALPPEASQAGTQAVQSTGPRRGVRPEPPVDRAAVDLRERVRLARDAAAAGVPTTLPAADPPMRPSAWIRSDASESAVPHLGKKPARKLVVDYTARPDEPAPPSLIAQSEEDPAIGRARSAYTTGNQRLFVGDIDGAAHAYREALEIYPGYVGGYRGLGLAYQQLGDTANALVALREYVAAVPNARDIALIKKRIAHLQRR
jgi:hypothetical protein